MRHGDLERLQRMLEAWRAGQTIDTEDAIEFAETLRDSQLNVKDLIEEPIEIQYPTASFFPKGNQFDNLKCLKGCDKTIKLNEARFKVTGGSFHVDCCSQKEKEFYDKISWYHNYRIKIGEIQKKPRYVKPEVLIPTPLADEFEAWQKAV